jgi:beta-N-acetylhexosaminidase
MSVLHKEIYSLLICGFSETTLPDDLQIQLRKGLGGVILFTRNYASREKLRQLCATIKELKPQAFIAVDQEGGRVSRFSKDFPTYPSAHYFGVRGDSEGLLHATSRTARSLYDCGVNLNLIPVCDLTPDETEHVISDRAFSDDSETTARAVAGQVEALAEAGLISCAKHFPGLQSGIGDPHNEMTRSNRSLERFREIDYTPFAAAIAAGVDMVMPTHMIASGIDPDRPATFSRIILRNELRDHLGFTGLIISDDLGMQAISEVWSSSQAAVSAIRAGCDLLIYGDPFDDLSQLVEEVGAAAAEDEELATRIESSAAAVRGFLAEYVRRTEDQ